MIIMAANYVYLRLKKERHSRHIGTRQYRSPEVVLGLPWDEKTDVARLDQGNQEHGRWRIFFREKTWEADPHDMFFLVRSHC